MHGTTESASQFYWYHCIDLPNGERTDGDFDMEAIVPHFQFPERMDGLRVLDIGRASGFFSFEFERRGAHVVATDIGSFFDWDFIGGAEERTRRLAEIPYPHDFSRYQIFGAFDYARRRLSSKVEAKFLNVYDIRPEAFADHDDGKFDIVFAGSLTSHLRDPILAFERIRSVTKRRFIVSAPTFSIPGTDESPLFHLVIGDPDRRSWWVMNRAGLRESLMAAGFARVELKSAFQLKHRRTGMGYDHLTAHAFV